MTAREPQTKAQTEFFTASDVARFCQVDLKTIHNWADKGDIRHFRTPGRHLRFRRLDVLDFLRRFGYPVPEALALGKPRVVAVETDPAALAALRKALARRFDLTTFQDPLDALVALGRLQPDALVIDFDAPGLDGIRCLERLRTVAETSHVRCIVYSARTDLATDARDAGAYDFVERGKLLELRTSLERLLGVDR